MLREKREIYKESDESLILRILSKSINLFVCFSLFTGTVRQLRDVQSCNNPSLKFIFFDERCRRDFVVFFLDSKLIIINTSSQPARLLCSLLWCCSLCWHPLMEFHEKKPSVEDHLLCPSFGDRRFVTSTSVLRRTTPV
jgi:hypothetical protein